MKSCKEREEDSAVSSFGHPIAAQTIHSGQAAHPHSPLHFESAGPQARGQETKPQARLSPPTYLPPLPRPSRAEVSAKLASQGPHLSQVPSRLRPAPGCHTAPARPGRAELRCASVLSSGFRRRMLGGPSGPRLLPCPGGARARLPGVPPALSSGLPGRKCWGQQNTISFQPVSKLLFEKMLLSSFISRCKTTFHAAKN